MAGADGLVEVCFITLDVMAFMKSLKLLHSLFPTGKTPYYSALLPTDDNPCRPISRRHLHS
jgi:hypothetical protein